MGQSSHLDLFTVDYRDTVTEKSRHTGHAGKTSKWGVSRVSCWWCVPYAVRAGGILSVKEGYV